MPTLENRKPCYDNFESLNQFSMARSPDTKMNLLLVRIFSPNSTSMVKQFGNERRPLSGLLPDSCSGGLSLAGHDLVARSVRRRAGGFIAASY